LGGKKVGIKQMDFKAHAIYSLQRSRWIISELIESLQNDDDWFFQANPKTNHALWIVGHLGLADNMFASRFRPDTADKPDGWDELFWFGSEIQSREAYPAIDAVRQYFASRRENLISVIESLTEDDLSGPAPSPEERSPIAGAPNIGHLLVFAAQHEFMHTGQFTIIHRALGNPPLFAPN